MDLYIVRPNGDKWPEIGRYWTTEEARAVAAALRKSGRGALCWKAQRSPRSIVESPLFVVYAEDKQS